jgi:hypothetical protein
VAWVPFLLVRYLWASKENEQSYFLFTLNLPRAPANSTVLNQAPRPLT